MFQDIVNESHYPESEDYVEDVETEVVVDDCGVD